MRITICNDDGKIAQFFDSENTAMFVKALVDDAYLTGKAKLTIEIDFPDAKCGETK